jgi:IPT/TIG domain
VTGVSPAAGSTAGGNTITITGTGFVSGATVKVGTVAATNVTYVSSTKLTAVAPAQAASTHNVYVTTPGGTSAATSGDQYAYRAGAGG